jgi:ATP-dependent protease HslVU (ClpYQ) peptidase subunit
MTCIVGLIKGDTVWLGGDRAATDGGLNRTLIKEPKVFVKRDVGFGVCGLPKVMDALQHTIELPEHVEGDDKGYLVGQLVPAIRDGLKKLECTEEHNGQQYFHGAMLIAYRGRLFQLEANFQLVESANGFDAVGSGGEAALGSLRATKKMGNPKKRLLEALKVSAENNAGVAPPFDVIFVKTRG